LAGAAVDSTSWYIRHEAALESIDAALATAHAIGEHAQVAECLTRMAFMDTCGDPVATENPILVFDAFGPIGFVMKFAADDLES
jgi:hypothetical protein